jgi:hypothetical protein
VEPPPPRAQAAAVLSPLALANLRFARVTAFDRSASLRCAVLSAVARRPAPAAREASGQGGGRCATCADAELRSHAHDDAWLAARRCAVSRAPVRFSDLPTSGNSEPEAATPDERVPRSLYRNVEDASSRRDGFEAKGIVHVGGLQATARTIVAEIRPVRPYQDRRHGLNMRPRRVYRQAHFERRRRGRCSGNRRRRSGQSDEPPAPDVHREIVARCVATPDRARVRAGKQKTNERAVVRRGGSGQLSQLTAEGIYAQGRRAQLGGRSAGRRRAVHDEACAHAHWRTRVGRLTPERSGDGYGPSCVLARHVDDRAEVRALPPMTQPRASYHRLLADWALG